MGFHKLEQPSAFRKMAAAMWRPPNDPHIFGFVDVDATAALQLLERYKADTGAKVTVTHLVVRGLALALARHPELNAKVGFSALWARDSVDIFCQVSTGSGRDLSGVKIKGVDKLSLKEISERLGSSARDIRADKDPSFRRSRNLMFRLPLWATRLMLRLADLLTNVFNFHLPGMGMPVDPFGSAMVTSVGMFGVDSGFAPFTPVARCPMILTVTRIKDRPWVVDGAVVPRPVLRLCGTFDHRVIDGATAGMLSGEMEQAFMDPSSLLTESERSGSSASPSGQPAA